MLYTSPDLHVEAWVEAIAGSTRLNEYRQRTSFDPKTNVPESLCEAFLECTEGASFRVKLKAPSLMLALQPGLVAYLYIDGKYITGVTWLSTTDTVQLDRMYLQEGGKSYTAELTFATLEKTDSEAAADVRGAELDKLCRIEVVVRRGYSAPTAVPHAIHAVKPVGKVHEKQLKLGSTVVAGNRTPYVPTGSNTFVPDVRRPDVARFVWTYHTRDKLEIMGLVEGPAVPAIPAANPRKRVRPTGEAANDAGDDEGDLEVLTGPRVKKEKLGKGTGVKQEPTTGGSWGASSKNRMKEGAFIDLTNVNQAGPSSRGKKGAVIDLTEDDDE